MIVGEKAAVKLVKRDAQSAIRLIGPLPGMTLENDVLNWLPASSDVGTVTVRLEIRSDKTRSRQDISFSVRNPSVELPFRAARASVSHDGKLAVVQAEVDRNIARQANQQQSARLALVDIEHMKLLAERTLDFTISAIDVDSKYVYAADQNADLVHVLSNKDLASVQRVFTQGRPRALQAVGDKLLFVATDRTSLGYSTADFTPTDAILMPHDNRTDSYYWRAVPMRVGDEWEFEDIRYSGDYTKARWMQAPTGFVTIPGPMPDNSPDHAIDREPAVWMWGSSVRPNAICRISEQTVAQLPVGVHVLLSDFPAVVSLPDIAAPGAVPRMSGEPAQSVTCEMIFSDLVNGRAVDRVVLFKEAPRRGTPAGVDPFGLRGLHARRGCVVGVIADRVFVVRTSGIDPRKYPMPLCFNPPKGVLSVEAGRELIVDVAAPGGSGELRYWLDSGVAGFSIDAKTGSVRIDTAKLVECASGDILDRVRRLGGYSATTKPSSFVTQSERIHKRSIATYERLVGKPPKGLVVAVPLGVSVRDSEQQTANLLQYVLLDVPLPDVMRAAQAREEQARSATPVVPATRPVLNVGGDDASQMRARITALEQENRELRAQVELLKELILDRRAPATRPASP